MKHFLLVLLLGFCALAFAQTKPELAVLPFSGGSGDDGNTISMLLANQPALRTVFTLLPRTSNIEMLMQEYDIERSGLTDSDTIAELGKQLNADFVVSGHIQRLGDRNLIHITIVGVESLEQIAGIYQEYRTIEEIRSLLPSMASKLASTANLNTASLPKLAVLPFDIPESVNVHDAETLAQILATELANSGKYAVLPRTSTIEAAMKEQDIQRSGLTDKNSIKAIGKATNADYVLAGTVTKLGSLNLFLVQILDVENGSMLTGDDKEYGTITDGLTLMPEMSDKLTGLQDERERARIAALAHERQQEAERQQQEAHRRQQEAQLKQEEANRQQQTAQEQAAKAQQERLAEEERRKAEAERQVQADWERRYGWKSNWLFLELRGGLAFNRAYILAEDFDVTGTLDTNPAFTFEAGASLSFQFLSFLALHAEAAITRDRVEYFNPNASSEPIGSFTSLSLKIPVLLKFTFRPGVILLSFFGGVYATVPLGQMEYVPASGDTASFDYSVPLAWTAGAALGVKLGPGALFVELRVSGDRGNTSLSDGKGTLQVYSRADGNPTVSLGYEIGFIRRK